MISNERKFKAQLFDGDNYFEVTITYSSRFTLHAEITEEQTANAKFKNSKIYSNLKLFFMNNAFDFGPCKTDETDKNKTKTKLIFLDDIYDFNALFKGNRITNNQSIASNLQLIFSQKDKIKPEFKEFVADFGYMLRAYRTFFDDMDEKLKHENKETFHRASNVVLQYEGENFLKMFHEKTAEMEKLVSSYSREDYENHGFYFRKAMWDIILTNDFFARSNIKPRGYAGDSEMMLMLYDRTYKGNSLFSRLVFRYGVEVPAAQSVRNRRILIPKIINQIASGEKIEEHGKFKVMSVACGPAYELQDLFITSDDTDKLSFTLLDQDTEALAEASEKVQFIEKNLGKKINAVYLNESVRTMIKTPNLHEKWGKFNLIYSMGLFDYLTPPVAKVVIEKIYSLLEPGGTLLIGNYHVINSSKCFMDYWLDWVLYYRTEDEFTELLKDTDAVSKEIIMEESRCQMFLKAKKPL